MLSDQVYNITKNPKYDGYQPGLASMVYHSFDKKPVARHSNSSGGAITGEIISNQKLDEEKHKLIIIKNLNNVRYTLLLKITFGLLLLQLCN